MFRWIVRMMERLREVFLALFIASLGFIGLQPDSQHGFVHDLKIASEYGHIALSVASFSVLIGAFVWVLFRERRLIARFFARVWNETKSLLKGSEE